jgi:hypothetical protein
VRPSGPAATHTLEGRMDKLGVTEVYKSVASI